MSMFPGGQAMPHPTHPSLPIRLHSRWVRGRGWETLGYGVPTAETPDQGSLQRNCTPSPNPRGLTVKYARNGGSVDAETEGGDGFAVIALVICHSPLQEKARQGWSCQDPLCGRGSLWDGVLRALIHTGVQEEFGLPHGGTLRFFCPRLLIYAALGGTRTPQRRTSSLGG